MNKLTKHITLGENKRVNFGCGSILKDGFVNIDLPGEWMYPRQEPQIYGDFTEMYFDKDSLDHISLHHVFEHFMRFEGVILLLRFNKWLKMGGVLELWMPDIEVCINEFPAASYKRKKELIRHMWGSHEGRWAIHCEGYYPQNLNEMLTACGFVGSFSSQRGQWPQFSAISTKVGEPNEIDIMNYLNDYEPAHELSAILRGFWMNEVKSELMDQKRIYG